MTEHACSRTGKLIDRDDAVGHLTPNGFAGQRQAMRTAEEVAFSS
jgi:hypothetical protein